MKLKVNRSYLIFGGAIVIIAATMFVWINRDTNNGKKAADDAATLDSALKIRQTQISAAPVEDAGRSLEPN